MYPYLKEDTKSLPEKCTKQGIYKNISAMFMHRVGDVVVNGADNLIMSAFVGVIPVGIYSNYMLLQASINTALNGVFGAVYGKYWRSGYEQKIMRGSSVYIKP